MNLTDKLKNARKYIGDTQAIASKRSGIAQRDISYLEAGKKKNLPTGYIIYLQKNGIDLNSLFDETKEMKTIEKDVDLYIKQLESILAEKKEMIFLLKDAIQLRDHKIQSLKMQSENLVTETV